MSRVRIYAPPLELAEIREIQRRAYVRSALFNLVAWVVIGVLVGAAIYFLGHIALHARLI